MRRAAVLLAIALAACRSAGLAPPASPTGCDIVVTRTADGRAGSAGCASPSAAPTVAGTQAPPREKDDHKGKGR